MPPHRIRLTGFWQADAGGRHARRFGRPTNLGPGDRVWLAGGPLPAAGAVAVNGTTVGSVAAGEPWAFDVTDLLQPRNEVAVEGPPADVALEIRSPVVTLAPAAPDDYAFTHDLTRGNMAGYVARYWGGWDEHVYRDNYARTDNLVIRLDSERVGFVRLFPEDGKLVLEDLQVLPAFQNRGIGTRALGEVERLARDRGLAAVRLRCFRENPAYRLYTRAGFAVVESGADADWLEKAVP